MSKRVIVLSVAVLAGTGVFALWRMMPPTQEFYTDAAQIREPADSARVREILWDPPRLLELSVNGELETYEPRLSNDSTIMYFVRGKAGSNADLYMAHRTAEGWGRPEPLSAINTEADELGPEISADGQELYFYSDRAGGLGGYDLWVSRRGTDGRWREPANLGPQINSTYNDYGPALTPDGRMLYFSSNRPLPGDEEQPDPDVWPATLREQFYSRTYDLFMAELTESGAGPARSLDGLNTPYNEGAPAVGAFGDFLCFASDRPGGAGGYDLYRSRRLRGGHEAVENLGTSLNTPHHELDPALSMNGFGLDFSSDRPVSGTGQDGARRYRLYHTNSREVFVERERLDRPAIDWAALWRAVGPNLLWALLALSLLLLMLLLFKGAQNRRLSLLAKCVLASLATHLLLMLLFNVWEVAAALSGEMRNGRTLKVTLTGPTSDSIATQITGALTEVQASPILPVGSKENLIEPIQVPTPSEFLPPRQRIELTASPTPDVADAQARTTPAQPIEPADVTSRSQIQQLSIPEAVAATSQGEYVQPAAAYPTRPLRVQASVPDSMPMATHEFAPGRAKIDGSQLSQLFSPDEFADAAPASVLSQSSLELRPLNVPLDQVALVALEPAQLEVATTKGQPEPQHAPTPAGTPSLKKVPVAALNADSQLEVQAALPAPLRSQFPLQPVAHSTIEPLTDSAPTRNEATSQVHPSLTTTDFAAIRVALPVPQIPESAEGAVNAPEAIANQPAVELRPTRLARQVDQIVPSIPTATNSTIARTSLDALAADRESPSLDGLIEAPNTRPTIRDMTDYAVYPAPDPSWSVDLSLPADLAPPENPYPQRTAQDRLENVKRLGGSEATEAAVALALEWLARHQSSQGHWDADGFDGQCGGCGGQTDIAADHALTGLGLLCFLGAGHTHTEPGPYQDNVQRAISWLVASQRPDGDLRGGKETMYTQGIATIALAESYAMTADPALADPVHRATRFIYRARSPQAGGWRYDPGQAGDTSVLGWQVMALKSAARAGVPVPQAAFDHARLWLDRVSRTAARGLYSYQPGEDPTASMTAEGLFVQQLLGLPQEDSRAIESVEFVLDHLPRWDKNAATYFWYYASLALFQHQGDAWRTWNSAISEELMAHQRKDGKAAGSWDTTDEWSRLGGRVYQTALCTLMLEVYYRYLPMYGEGALAAAETADLGPDDEVIGTIRGTVTEKTTQRPLSGAQVRLVLSDRETLTATSDSAGKFVLRVPATPDFFALSASHDAFVPQTVSVERARLESRKKLTINFALEPDSPNALVTEVQPDVHHLGDDRFSGDINSQFQKKSEGSKFAIGFDIDGQQLTPPPQRAEIRLMAKGVQRRHKIFVNDSLLDRRLENSPEDGSFGEFVANFDPALLKTGGNTLRIEALPSDSDIDDFEFVNIRIYLAPALGVSAGDTQPIKLGATPVGTQ